ncbi:MAG: HAD family phosphatase [Planctomycetota bacterium]|nr:HAD family phosphatase [Planctomycetota bacterium]MDA1249132.1 HAD family phosphatase [Planctomycetota bacterium]
MPTELPAEPILAVAFDLDGLIVNTEHVFHLAMAELVEARGMAIPNGLPRAMMGKRPQDSYGIMKQMLGVEDSPEALHDETHDRFFRLLEIHLDLMPGVFELLDQLERFGLPKAVATSSPRKYLSGILERFDLTDRFAFSLTAEDVVNGKPHPEIYLAAADRHGIAPQQMLVFEDSENGTRAGSSAGAFVVSVPHDHSRDHEFSPTGLVADTLSDPRIASILNAHRETP